MKIVYLIIALLLVLIYNGCGQSASISGTSSLSCTVVVLPVQSGMPNGGTIIKCPDGTTALITNGFTFQSIQFCPGVTPSYPTTFPEVGFCINNVLYAVYSANNGFLTVIPTGYYNSNAIGSACSFTVIPNCGIVN